jgi:hypothetical protein
MDLLNVVSKKEQEIFFILILIKLSFFYRNGTSEWFVDCGKQKGAGIFFILILIILIITFFFFIGIELRDGTSEWIC